MKAFCLLLLLLPLAVVIQSKKPEKIEKSSQHKKKPEKKKRKIYSISCETYECANMKCVRTYKTYSHPRICHGYRNSAWVFNTIEGDRVDANACHALSKKER